MVVSTDPDHRFDLALHLEKLEVAREIAVEAESEHKWKQLGEAALHACMFDLAEEALGHAQDYSSQLLLYRYLRVLSENYALRTHVPVALQCCRKGRQVERVVPNSP